MSSITVHGLTETQREIRQFSDKLANKVISLALKNTAKAYSNKLKSSTPKKTGRLQNSIMTGTSKYNTYRKNGKIQTYVTFRDKGGRLGADR